MENEDNRKYKEGQLVHFISNDGIEEFGYIDPIVNRPDRKIFHIDGFYHISVEIIGDSKDKVDYIDGYSDIPEENITSYNVWRREDKINQVLDE